MFSGQSLFSVSKGYDLIKAHIALLGKYPESLSSRVRADWNKIESDLKDQNFCSFEGKMLLSSRQKIEPEDPQQRLISLLKKGLTLDPEKRSSCEDLLEEAYLIAKVFIQDS